MCAQLHFNVCKERGVKLEKEHRYDHAPKSVETGHESNVTILWNEPVKTDETIPNTKPAYTIHGNEKGTCMLLRHCKVRR
jgi:hypothetical protein